MCGVKNHDFTAPDRVTAALILNRKYQTYWLFTTPRRAASGGSPAKANEKEQTGRHQQLDASHFYSTFLLQRLCFSY